MSGFCAPTFEVYPHKLREGLPVFRCVALCRGDIALRMIEAEGANLSWDFCQNLTINQVSIIYRNLIIYI